MSQDEVPPPYSQLPSQDVSAWQEVAPTVPISDSQPVSQQSTLPFEEIQDEVKDEVEEPVNKRKRNDEGRALEKKSKSNKLHESIHCVLAVKRESNAELPSVHLADKEYAFSKPLKEEMYEKRTISHFFPCPYGENLCVLVEVDGELYKKELEGQEQRLAVSLGDHKLTYDSYTSSLSATEPAYFMFTIAPEDVRNEDTVQIDCSVSSP